MSWLAYVPAIAAAVAAGTFVFSVYKQVEDRAAAREASAKKAWADYLQMAFEHPKEASASVNLKRASFARERYEWFVSRLLFAAEEVLFFAPDDRHWNGTINSQLEYHRSYLKGRGRQYTDHYSPKLQALLKRQIDA